MNGTLLMTYGSPASVERPEVGAYMTRVRGGRAPNAELVEEFTRRYRIIGGSPLIEITRRQAAAVAAVTGWPTVAGMRFSDPSIDQAIADLRGFGVDSVAAIVLSPQYSPLLMDGYTRSLEIAAARIGSGAPSWSVAGAWHLEPILVRGFAARIVAALDRLPGPQASTAPVLLTAHSLPLRIAEQEPGYLQQLRETATAIAAAAGLTPDRWRFCWQSAGHEPGAWMKPDFADLMPELAAAGHRSVVVAPVQFLADHLEILYDVDIGAREQADRHGLRFERIESMNDAPELVETLASVARRLLATGTAFSAA